MSLELPDKIGFLKVQHGLGIAVDNQEHCYVIDADFYSHAKIGGSSDAWNVLDQFNSEARLFFRWCITEKLHHALEPTSA